MAYLSLSPVSVAIFTALNVSALTNLATGGIHDSILPQGTTYPCVLFEVSEDQQLGGFGTKPGRGMLPQIGLRLHVFSKYVGMSEAQSVMQKAIQLLADPPPVTGYSSWAIFHDSTIPLPDQVVSGEPVQELVANLRMYVEEA